MCSSDLGKAREEDIIADTLAAPLQEVRTFNSDNKFDDGWTNKLIFGDNLMALKNLYEDPKIKGKVKLIYIDPPFATKQDFMKDEEKSYRDKIIGSKFLEFTRKRLIFLYQLLDSDGVIFVHLDWKKGHYLKILLDELFGENNLINEIVWCRSSSSAKKAGSKEDENSKTFIRAHDVIYIYAKDSKSFRGIKKTNLTSIPYSERVLDSVEEDEEGNAVYNRGGGSIGGKKIAEKVSVDIEAGM